MRFSQPSTRARADGHWFRTPSRRKGSVGVGDQSEFLEEETPIPDGGGNGGKKPKRGSPSKRRTTRVRDNGGEESPDAERVPDRRMSRERSLNRLLAGL